MRCDAIWGDIMRWQRDWIDLRGAAHTVVEKRSEIIDAIATEASPFDGADRQRVDQRFSPSRSASPIPTRTPPPPTAFLRKITHGGHLFVCSVRLLGPCSEIDRRLRPTDVCSAATALTLRHRKNIIGFSFLIFFFFSSFFLMHHLLIRFLPTWEQARRAFYSSPVRDFGTLENPFCACTYQYFKYVM